VASSLMPSGTRPPASQIALINRVRQLRADLVAAHPKSERAALRRETERRDRTPAPRETPADHRIHHASAVSMAASPTRFLGWVRAFISHAAHFHTVL